MRSLRLVAILALALVVAACSSGSAAGWTFTPTQAPPSAAAASGSGAGSAGPGGSAPASAGASGSAPSASGSAAGSGGSGTSIALSAQGIKFDKTTLDASANTAFTINFTNNDSGVPHNVVIKSASGQALFTGDTISGPASKAYAVPALAAGTYTFFCAVHPTLMTGTLTVK